MNKRIFRLILVIVAMSCLLCACTSELKPKTVIIPDSKESNEPDKVSEEFAVNKIYTLADSGVANGDILGWIDQKQLLGAYFMDLNRSFERVDYKFNAHQKIKAVENTKQSSRLSPDGRYIAYFANDRPSSKLMLLDLTNNQETVIKAKVPAPYLIDPLKWSNNSRYVAYGMGSGRANDQLGSLMVYDILHKSTVEYQVPDGISTK